MTTWQAFLLGLMIALLPSMAFLAFSLYGETEHGDGDLTTR